MPSVDLAALRAAVKNSRYIITAHARQRIGLRKAGDADVRQVILQGQLN